MSRSLKTSSSAGPAQPDKRTVHPPGGTNRATASTAPPRPVILSPTASAIALSENASLKQSVSELVSAYMSDNQLPGLTVAVSRNGRLILSEGYGMAKVAGSNSQPMTRQTRCRVGSVTKATVTGPSTFQLLKVKGIDPKTTKVYGPNGFFKGQFDGDIDQGIATFAPESGNWKTWYNQITIQDLFDHKSGFITTPSKSVEKAAKMFGVDPQDVTYEQVHRWFLRTQALLSAPGTYSYSNHNFGMMTLLVEDMAGKTFHEYARDDYLKPMNLHNGLQPQKEWSDSADAYGHILSRGQFVPQEYDASTLGMAAGGFRASAQDLVGVTEVLKKTYPWEEINAMGWGSNSKGKLTHGGRIGGGAARVSMFPTGYISNSGLDIGGIHVAIATNISASSSGLDKLANKIVLAVPASEVPDSFDLWKEVLDSISCERVHSGLTSSEYQRAFDDGVRSGYRPVWADGFTVNGRVRFNLVLRSTRTGPKPAWVARHNMTGASYQENFDKFVGSGYSLTHVDSYAVGNSVRYAAIWVKGAGAFTAYHGRSAKEHQKRFDDLTKKGWRPAVISVASINGKRSYTALYNKSNLGAYEARSFLTPAQYQTRTNANVAAGRHLVYLNAYEHGGQPRFSAIWASEPKTGYRARHGLTASQLWAQWEKNMADGKQTGAITGYQHAGKPRYAAYWT